MALKMKVRIEIGPRLKEAMAKAPQIVITHLEQAMKAATIHVVGRVRDFITRIGLVDTGHLRRSIADRVERTNRAIRGWIGSRVKYARIHEFGGFIRPVRKKVLAWVTHGQRPTTPEGWRQARREGRAVIARRGVRIREKAYMRRGLRLSIRRIEEIFQARATAALREIFGDRRAR